MKVEKHLINASDRAYMVSYVIDRYTEFQSEKQRRAVLVCPGGGYEFLSDREGEPVALKFVAQGYNAFLLQYSTGSSERGNVFPYALSDIAHAIDYLKTNADSFSIDPEKIILIGFSAGAHLCASMGNMASHPALQSLGSFRNSLDVAAVVLCYPWISLEAMYLRLAQCEPGSETPVYFEHANISFSGVSDPFHEAPDYYDPVKTVSASTPPTFIWHTSNDDLVFVDCSLKYTSALSANHVPFELHIFENGHHGLALCDKTTENRTVDYRPDLVCWQDLMFKWLNAHIEY